MADGTKLKPMVVFKQKTMPKDKFSPGLLVCVQEKGWVDNSVLKQWLHKVWFQHPGALMKKKLLLVSVMFLVHLTDQVKAKLKNANTLPAVIPGGCASVLQPLDVCLTNLQKQSARTVP